MQPLPSADLRFNRGTWSVPATCVPAAVLGLMAQLPAERYDPAFLGQALETYYFDDGQRHLRKARQKGDRYLTLRVRYYSPSYTLPPGGGGQGGGVYALSIKTEDQKFRREIDAALAEPFLHDGLTTGDLSGLAPADLVARFAELVPAGETSVVVCVQAQRYARENADDRLTLDLAIRTDTGKCFPTNVLEWKSTRQSQTFSPLPGMRPIKLSKFLWATQF